MRRKLCTAVFSFALTAVVVLAVMIFMPADASAFSQYVGAGNCEQCHTADDFGGIGAPLHDLHVPMSPDCNVCHPSGGGSKPVLIKSSGPLAAGGMGVGCIGCHDGPGLRQHHRTTGAATCEGCHANPESPVGENILPAYYNTASVNGVNDPCNPTAAAMTNENWDGNFVGLDNDGDDIYDGNDPDCGGAPPAAADYNVKTGILSSMETLVGKKAYSIELTKDAAAVTDDLSNAAAFTLTLTNFSKVTPTGNESCTFTGATGVLDCPIVNVGKNSYHVILDKLSGGFQFQLRSATKN